MQADLASTRQQRDELDAQSRRLAGELRDAIYSLSQMVAAQQGQVVSWAVRGLTSTAVQTQHCELWEAAVRFGGSSGGSVGSATACSPGNAALAGGASGDGSVLCAPEQSAASAASGADDGEEPPAEPAAGAAPRVLQLAALQQQIRALYRAKALHDIAVARGQRPFMPLPDFVAAHLTLQSGVDGPAVQQRAAQLQASVEAHAAADRDVTLFGLAAGMLEEVEAGGDAGSSAGASTSSCAVVVQPGGSAASASAAAAAVPLVLYHSRRCVSTSAAQQAADTLPTLRRFCAASWHAAYLRSAARSALARPFDPAGPAQLLHPMAAEVHNLAVAVPGVEQLMCWVLQGGLGACLGALDLGLRLAESQVGLDGLVGSGWLGCNRQLTGWTVMHNVSCSWQRFGIRGAATVLQSSQWSYPSCLARPASPPLPRHRCPSCTCWPWRAAACSAWPPPLPCTSRAPQRQPLTTCCCPRAPACTASMAACRLSRQEGRWRQAAAP